MSRNVIHVEELVGYQMTLFDEPDKDKACDEAYHCLGIVPFIVGFCLKVVGETHNLDSPSMPVGKFLIKSLCQYLDREAAAQVFDADYRPSFVEYFLGVCWEIPSPR